jgi:hypothetical protein
MVRFCPVCVHTNADGCSVSQITFRKEHREIEVRLDKLLIALDPASIPVDEFHSAHAAVAAHYFNEDTYFRGFLPEFRGAVCKMLGQHEEALEIAQQAEDSLELGK